MRLAPERRNVLRSGWSAMVAPRGGDDGWRLRFDVEAHPRRWASNGIALLQYARSTDPTYGGGSGRKRVGGNPQHQRVDNANGRRLSIFWRLGFTGPARHGRREPERGRWIERLLAARLGNRPKVERAQLGKLAFQPLDCLLERTRFALLPEALREVDPDV